MHLKSLNLRGFKTFADKTSFTFEPAPSITAIVGPNGCGKSNVIDALRFVLGEQSIKDLRGTSLEQVIFAGTSAKKALSMAEVSIDIDNSDMKLKADYSEIQVKRRVFRSGESEFYINKNLCRLRDIKELFLDTGIGNGAYSIVNQGQVDSILSSKPEERRAIFEEAASIGKYKFRKRAAERRLIGTEQNLLRVNDLKTEIRENLSTLESQAAKARQYKEIKDQLRILEIGLGKKQVRALTDKKEALTKRIEELRAATAGVEAGVFQEEEERTKLKAEVRALEEQIELIRQQIAQARSSSEEARRRISVGTERAAQLGERTDQLNGDIARLNSLLGSKKEKLEEKNAALDQYKSQFGEVNRYLEDAKRTFEEINKRIEESVSSWNSLKNPIFQREIEISGKKHSIAEIDLSIKYAKEAHSKEQAFFDNLVGLKDDIAQLETELFALDGVSQDLKDRISARKASIFQKLEIEISVIEKNIEAQKTEIGKIEADRQKAAGELVTIESTVGEMNEQYRQLEQNLKNLNSEKEKALMHLAETRAQHVNFDSTLRQRTEEQTNAKGDLAQSEAELAAKTAELSSLAVRIEETKKEIASLEASVPELGEKETALSAEIQGLSDKKNAKQAKLETLEEKIKSLSSEDRGARDALSKEEVNLAKVEGELSAIEMLMQQEYNMSVEQMLGSEIEDVSNTAKAKEEIDSMKTAIRDMGAVNLLAVEEFEAAKERLSFIEAQYQDLIAARDNINSLIKELDSEARSRFMKMIDEVNVHFTQIFATLFEGGEAKITMSDGDPLESGIEIMARPSGKKWLTLSLMSGGEKALTAISILFSLMRTNPSPFCFMDEVDAALDEINTIRFTKLLKEFSKNTQIVVVTHSKRTMSSAGTMFGVTQEEPGISKLVSMKLVKVAD